MKRWVAPALDRQQALLFSERLDEAVPPGHPVRVYDAILDRFDWTEWEATYEWFGRPSYHPRDLCKLLIYCYSRGIRSSRLIEDACRNRYDVIWLMAGRTPDHDTIAEFRAHHRERFKVTFRQTVRATREVGLTDYNLAVIDGTKVQANNGRQAASTEADLAKQMAQLDERIEQMLQAAEQADQADQSLFGAGGLSPKAQGLKALQRQHKRLQHALDRLQAEREQAHARGEDRDDTRRPTTDPDSRIMPGKHGDFQPAYSPQIAVDPSSSIILAEDVTPAAVDREELVPMIEHVQTNTGQAPQAVIADSNYNSGPNLEACAKKGIPTYMPDSGERSDGRRHSPKELELTPEQQAAMQQATGQAMASLPMDPSTKRIGKLAFRYQEEANEYVCPMGRVLKQYMTQQLPGEGAERYSFRCDTCAGCALLGMCVKNPDHPRVVSHDSYEPLRQALRERVSSPRGKDFSDKRRRVESPFGVIKAVMGVRQFLVRGANKVKGEWTLICTAYDLKRLVNYLRRNPSAMALLT